MIAVVILIVLALLFILGYALRIFRIEKVSGDDDNAYSADGSSTPEAQEEGAPGEMVDLFNYFGDEEQKSAAPQQEEIAAEFDKISEFKVGRGYLRDCQMLLDIAQQEGAVYAAAYLDFDRFRFINSLKGLSIGDYVLSHFATEITSIFPMGSQFTRISADHFIAFFPLISENMFEEYTEQIKRACEKIRGDVGIKGGLRVCMGISMTESARDYDISVLICKANIARHCLKISKSEAFAVYNESMVTSYLYGESLLDDYAEYQFGDDFHIYYQPQSDVNKKRIVASSVLARWICEDSNKERVVSSENSGIPTNNARIFYQVCRSMSRWRKSGKDVLPSYITLSPIEFFIDDIDSFFVKCLSEFQLEPSMLGVVIDKNMLSIEPSISGRQIKKFKDMGICVIIDGFDTNFSGNLDFLDGIGVTHIKLSGSLTNDIERDVDRAAFVKRIIQSAGSKGIHTICDGADNVDRVEALKGCGCSLVEGRYCGRPALAEDYARTLQEYVQKQKGYSDQTVILEEVDFKRGDFY